MGIAFGYFENTFYQYIDENDVLIESWFMPLSFLCIFLGSLGVFFVAVKATFHSPVNTVSGTACVSNKKDTILN